MLFGRMWDKYTWTAVGFVHPRWNLGFSGFGILSSLSPIGSGASCTWGTAYSPGLLSLYFWKQSVLYLPKSHPLHLDSPFRVKNLEKCGL